jgi:hypothetical protein
VEWIKYSVGALNKSCNNLRPKWPLFREDRTQTAQGENAWLLCSKIRLPGGIKLARVFPRQNLPESESENIRFSKSGINYTSSLSWWWEGPLHYLLGCIQDCMSVETNHSTSSLPKLMTGGIAERDHYWQPSWVTGVELAIGDPFYPSIF